MRTRAGPAASIRTKLLAACAMLKGRPRALSARYRSSDCFPPNSIITERSRRAPYAMPATAPAQAKPSLLTRRPLARASTAPAIPTIPQLLPSATVSRAPARARSWRRAPRARPPRSRARHRGRSLARRATSVVATTFGTGASASLALRPPVPPSRPPRRRAARLPRALEPEEAAEQGKAEDRERGRPASSPLRPLTLGAEQRRPPARGDQFGRR